MVTRVCAILLPFIISCSADSKVGDFKNSKDKLIATVPQGFSLPNRACTLAISHNGQTVAYIAEKSVSEGYVIKGEQWSKPFPGI